MNRSLSSEELCAFYPLIQQTSVFCVLRSWGPKSNMVSVLINFLTGRKANTGNWGGRLRAGSKSKPRGVTPGKFPQRSVMLDLKSKPRVGKHFL